MLEAAGLSDAGCIRPNNEDCFISEPQFGIFILADGMGGANAGEHASQLSVRVIYEFLLAHRSSRSITTLREGFELANRRVRTAAANDPQLEGMGTTLLVAREVDDGQFQIASVGDSRAYLFSEQGFFPLTKDQTWVTEVGMKLGLKDEALRKHPMRHVLTMAIGATEDLRVNMQTVQIMSGDQLLLCSDGLHGVLDEKTLEQTLDSEKTLTEKCHYLVEAAKEQGGPDNVTVILIQLT